MVMNLSSHNGLPIINEVTEKIKAIWLKYDYDNSEELDKEEVK